MERAGEACRNGMRRTMSERWRKGGAKPGRADALKAEHDGLFPPVFRHPLRTNQGGSGEIISPGGAWGGAPHTKPIPRSRTGPALFRSERGVGDPAAFSRRSFSICYGQIKGARGKLFPPAGRGAEPRIPNPSREAEPAPRCSEASVASGDAAAFSRRSFGIRYGQIKGARGKLFPPAGRGAEPRIANTSPVVVISG